MDMEREVRDLIARRDITKALHRGRNSIVIRVVNTWANALKGVSDGAPPFDGIWTNAKYRRADNTLLPAGLLGPLKIKYDEEYIFYFIIDGNYLFFG